MYLAGRLRTRKWTRKYTRAGLGRYPTEVIVEDLIMLPNGNGRAVAPTSAPAGDPDIDDDIRSDGSATGPGG